MINHTMYSKESSSGPSPLHRACEDGNIGDVRTFLNGKKGMLNSQAKHGRTPLHLACSKGNLEICQYLVEQGADLEIKGNGRVDTHRTNSAVYGPSFVRTKEVFL